MISIFKETPEYLNEQIVNEIEEKGFSVYNYISLKELILTARKDFLSILLFISTPFAVLSIWIWMIWFYWVWFLLLFFFFFLVYFLIFSIVFLKLLYRTYIFLKISNVVYTKKWLIISDDIIYYKKDKEFLEKKFLKYEKEFAEYLWKPSNLEEIISKKKLSLFENTKTSWSNIWKILMRFTDSKNSMWIALLFSISFALYVVFLYITYYIWYFLSFILSSIYIFFLNIILYFKKNVEIKIKNKVLEIDNHINKLNEIYETLESKIDDFKSWEISDISDFVEDKFRDFYTQIDVILQEKTNLHKIIEFSKFKDFIDFDIFKSYLKHNFNKPVLGMIELLETYEKLLNKQIKEIEKTNTGKEIFQSNLSQKEFNLEDKLRILKSNKQMLEMSILE